MDQKKIKNFDKGFVFKTYENFHKQFEQIFREFKNVDLSKIKNALPTHSSLSLRAQLSESKTGRQVNKILVCGMGGSALGAHFVRSVFSRDISIPIFISNEYSLPKWVDKQTLVVISSFSGTTEESVSCFKEAKKNSFKTFVICTGGELSSVDSAKFIYESTYNYAKNPRFAAGYSIAGFICLLSRLGFLKYSISKFEKEIKLFAKGKLLAERIAKSISGKTPIIIASEHLTGNAHVFQNQINETGKNFSTYFTIPEICHHQFEGLSNPENLNKQIIYVLLNSSFYYKRNQKRYEIMKEILTKKKIKFIEIRVNCKNIYEEAMCVLGASSYASFYLAYFNNIDPQPNPFVDYLKKRMKE